MAHLWPMYGLVIAQHGFYQIQNEYRFMAHAWISANSDDQRLVMIVRQPLWLAHLRSTRSIPTSVFLIRKELWMALFPMKMKILPVRLSDFSKIKCQINFQYLWWNTHMDQQLCSKSSVFFGFFILLRPVDKHSQLAKVCQIWWLHWWLWAASEILIRSESTWHYFEKIFYHSPVKECEFCEKRVPPQFRKDWNFP